MRRFKNTSVFILIITACFAFINIEKSVDKIVLKVWKGTAVKKNEITVPDSLQSKVGKIYKLLIDDSLVGYACYSTAFGCQVGGCAKPSNPNSQAYETFDYVIVFDKNLSILKVEIIQYPGAYGYQICRRKWLDQFIGKTPYLMLNKDVDGVSGATISAQFLVDDINKVKIILESIK